MRRAVAGKESSAATPSATGKEPRSKTVVHAVEAQSSLMNILPDVFESQPRGSRPKPDRNSLMDLGPEVFDAKPKDPRTSRARVDRNSLMNLEPDIFASQPHLKPSAKKPSVFDLNADELFNDAQNITNQIGEKHRKSMESIHFSQASLQQKDSDHDSLFDVNAAVMDSPVSPVHAEFPASPLDVVQQTFREEGGSKSETAPLQEASMRPESASTQGREWTPRPTSTSAQATPFTSQKPLPTARTIIPTERSGTERQDSASGSTYHSTDGSYEADPLPARDLASEIEESAIRISKMPGNARNRYDQNSEASSASSIGAVTPAVVGGPKLVTTSTPNRIAENTSIIAKAAAAAEKSSSLRQVKSHPRTSLLSKGSTLPKSFAAANQAGHSPAGHPSSAPLSDVNTSSLDLESTSLAAIAKALDNESVFSYPISTDGRGDIGEENTSVIQGTAIYNEDEPTEPKTRGNPENRNKQQQEPSIAQQTQEAQSVQPTPREKRRSQGMSVSGARTSVSFAETPVFEIDQQRNSSVQQNGNSTMVYDDDSPLLSRAVDQSTTGTLFDTVSLVGSPQISTFCSAESSQVANPSNPSVTRGSSTLPPSSQISVKASGKVIRSAAMLPDEVTPGDMAVLEEIGLNWKDDTIPNRHDPTSTGRRGRSDKGTGAGDADNAPIIVGNKVTIGTQTDRVGDNVYGGPVLPSQLASMHSLMIRQEEQFAFPELELSYHPTGLTQSTLGRRKLQRNTEANKSIRKSLEQLSKEMGDQAVTAELADVKEYALSTSSGSFFIFGRRRKKRVEVENKRAKLGVVKRFAYDVRRYVHRKRRDVERRSGLWAKDLRLIESRFGSGIVSYFTLFRWIFVMNMVLGFIWFVFVILFGAIDMFSDDYYGWRRFYYYHAKPYNGTVSETLDNSASIRDLLQGLFSGNVCLTGRGSLI